MKPRTRSKRTAIIHVSCGLCRGSEFSLYAPAMYEFQECRFDLIRCKSCGNVQVDPMLQGRVLTQMYSASDYFLHDYDSGVTATAYRDNRDPILARYRYASDLLTEFHPAPGQLLEVGCAHGFFLEEMKQRGWDTLGVELSPPAVREARRRGLKVIQGDLFKAHLRTASLDAILLGDVLEHVPEPVVLLREIRRILKPGGTLIVKCPRFLNSWAFRIIYGLSRVLKPLPTGRIRLLGLMKVPWHREQPGRPYHLYEYNRSTMRRVLQEADLVVREIRTHTIRITFVEHLSRNPVLQRLWWAFFSVMRGICIVLDLPFGSVVGVATRR